jgi:predicted transcriptional regulator
MKTKVYGQPPIRERLVQVLSHEPSRSFTVDDLQHILEASRSAIQTELLGMTYTNRVEVSQVPGRRKGGRAKAYKWIS